LGESPVNKQTAISNHDTASSDCIARAGLSFGARLAEMSMGRRKRSWAHKLTAGWLVLL
jgi:hypothetical protein